MAAQGLPCLEGLSFRVFLLLSNRAHFNKGSFPAFADNPMRYSRLSTAHLHTEERGFGCGCAAAPGSLLPVVPNWLQPSTPGSIPPGSIPSPQQLLITKILNLTSALVSIKIRSLISPCRSVPLCSHPPGHTWSLPTTCWGSARTAALTASPDTCRWIF